MSLTNTDWILIAGFLLVAYGLNQIHDTMKQILLQLDSIQSNTAPPLKMPVF